MSSEDGIAGAFHAAGPELGPDVVVVGLEGSEPSMRALAWALGLASRSRASLIRVHVAGAGTSGILAPEKLAALGAPEGLAAWATADRQTYRYLEHTQLDRLFSEIARTSGLEVALEHVAGDPVDQIMQAAHRHRADLLVVGAPRSGRAARRSVAARLTHQSLCPVTVVP